jgi:hypothetical protein
VVIRYSSVASCLRSTAAIDDVPDLVFMSAHLSKFSPEVYGRDSYQYSLQTWTKRDLNELIGIVSSTTFVTMARFRRKNAAETTHTAGDNVSGETKRSLRLDLHWIRNTGVQEYYKSVSFIERR